MKYCSFSILLAGLLFGSCQSSTEQETLEQRIDRISRAEMESVAELLGHDLYEGRAPGTRGGELAEVTMQGLFKLMDLAPGMEDSYYQPFVMTGFSNEGFEINANGMKLNYPDDVVGSFTVKEEEIDLEGEAVYVGFGVKADIWDWDDYKDADVRDKIVISRVNDPGMVNPDIFEGSTLTYFGRWTCHIEEAERRGAAGILLIHTDESAGYDWNVVKNSWSGEELFIDPDLQNNLKFRGWIRESSLREVLDAEQIDLDKLYEDAASKDFRPVDPGIRIRIQGNNTFREVMNRNVVAEIPGKTRERIVLSAHIDHLGMDPGVEGDQIYNGAIDNGTAVGAMMVAAKILKEFQDELRYTITILACNAEESGLLGSKYYARNSERNSIIANINFESTPVWSEAKSIMGIGARFSGFEEIIQNLARENNLEYSTFSLSNQGLFYRSDQFSFARYGIPSVWISAGEDEISGARNYTEFWGKDYHTVKDEYDPGWDLGGMKQTIRFALLLIEQINRMKTAPQMKSDVSFPVEDN
ncbi:MAG: M28 family peptidase [Bacteroidales bacterium]|nr:M28 family peptidase [Bacteroidales bacterium]